MRFIPIAGFLFLVVMLAYMLITKPENAEANSTENKPLPTLELKAMEGKGAWDQKNLQGHITVINFFASWCSPCEAEMPELTALKKAFPGVQFEGIAWNDEPATMKKWLQKHGNPFDHVWIDTDGAATMALGLRGIPETIIVDPQGNMRYRLSGPVTKARRTADIDPILTKLQGEAHAP